MSGTQGLSSHEFCLICAKPEELRQVIEIFDKKFQKARGRRLTDQVYSVASPSGNLSLLVTTCVGMGHMNAAVRTTQVITLNQPGLLFFLGTAASLKPEELQIGDVVLPRKAINRMYEKVSEKGQRDYDARTKAGDFKETFFGDNALISDISTVNCSAEALGAIASLPIKEIHLEKGDETQIEIDGEKINLRDPLIFDDIDIFSCGMVVDSISYRQFLTEIADQNMRKVGAIDMESYGFFSAIDATKLNGVGNACEGIMIRGISDYAGRKQQTENRPASWKQKSVRNAAIVAAELVTRLAAVSSRADVP